MSKRGDETKGKILKAALDLFVKQGIDRTTTSEITQKVGIAEGTLFVHFKTKQDLIDALYLNIKADQAQNFSEKVLDTDDPRETVINMTEVMCSYFLKKKKEFYFMEMVHNTDHVSQSAMRASMERFAKMMQKMQEWQEKGVLKKGDCEFFWIYHLAYVQGNYRVFNYEKTKSDTKRCNRDCVGCN